MTPLPPPPKQVGAAQRLGIDARQLDLVFVYELGHFLLVGLGDVGLLSHHQLDAVEGRPDVVFQLALVVSTEEEIHCSSSFSQPALDLRSLVAAAVLNQHTKPSSDPIPRNPGFPYDVVEAENTSPAKSFFSCEI